MSRRWDRARVYIITLFQTIKQIIDDVSILGGIRHPYKVLDDGGLTSTVYILPRRPLRVLKVFKTTHAQLYFTTERTAYERFALNSPPSTIPDYNGIYRGLPYGIIIGYAENGSLFHYIRKQAAIGPQTPIVPILVYRWALETVSGLSFAHKLGILHSDIHPLNLFLDSSLHLKVGDWSGASIDGSVSLSFYRQRYSSLNGDGVEHAREDGISVQTEIFALGSLFYFMVTGHDIWPELEDDNGKHLEEMRYRLTRRMFPKHRVRALGSIIFKCWMVHFRNDCYKSMDEVREAIESEMPGLGLCYDDLGFDR